MSHVELQAATSSKRRDCFGGLAGSMVVDSCEAGAFSCQQVSIHASHL